MASKKDWVTQERIDDAADALVSKQNIKPAEVTAYAVATSLNCSPNGSVCEKVRDWRRRRQETENKNRTYSKGEFKAQLQGILVKGVEEQTQLIIGTLDNYVETLNQTMLMNAETQKLNDDVANAEFAELVKLSADIEKRLEIAVATERTTAAALQEAKLMNQRLEGKVEALERQLAQRTRISEHSVVETRPNDTVDCDMDNENSDASLAMVDRDIFAPPAMANLTTKEAGNVAEVLAPAATPSPDATRAVMMQTEIEYDGGGKVQVRAAQPSLPVPPEAVENASALGDPSPAAQDRSMPTGQAEPVLRSSLRPIGELDKKQPPMDV